MARQSSRLLHLLGILFSAGSLTAQVAPSPQYPGLPSEAPAELKPPTDGFDYVRRDVMIPMRDGVKLHTVILLPNGAKGAPILLTRTPYDANALTTNAQSSHLGPTLYGYDNATDVIVEGGYIRVVQDVRGKYGSEGDYVMNRPLHGPQNPTPVDHATDTWDTIDWLVKHIPESNGKVGILGISYDGFLPLMALVNPHPALKVAVPMNPMVDGWMGDDWFHNGAFRQQNMPYIYEQVVTRDNSARWWTSNFDDYDMYMQAGSAGELGRRRGLEQSGFWRKILAHPAYDAFWRDQAVDKILATQPLKVPVMLVHSLWDQEDIYGRDRGLPRDQAEGHRQQHGVPGPRPLVSWPGDRRREQPRCAPVQQQHRALLPAAGPASLPRSVSEGWRAQGGHRAGHGVRDRHQCLAATAGVAGGLHQRLHPPSDAALPASRTLALVHGARGRWGGGVRRVHLRSGQAGAVPRPSDSADRLRRRLHVGALAGRRSARGLGAPRRPGVHVGGADGAGEDQRTAGGAPGGVHRRHRRRLGGEADRRLSRTKWRSSRRWAGTS